MSLNVAQKLIQSHLLDGDMRPGGEIALKVDQTLLQDVLGTLVMLELEAMGIERVKVGLAAQYVDHNLVQNDHMNADEHLFLRSACRRFGVWYSRPGNGISHPVHMQRFGKPGMTLVGSDSHTPAAGSLGMLAFGAGGIEVALAMAGEPLHLRMPQIWGVQLTGSLPEWVSAKDVILEMLRRHGVEGGFGRIVEYYGPGLAGLTAMDRHVIANMGAELGATTTVFPSDEATRRFLRDEGREEDWVEILRRRGRDLRRSRRDRPLDARTADRQAVEPRQRRAGARGRRDGDLPSLHRLLGQSGLPRLRHRGAHGPRPPGPRPRVLRHQSQLAPGARKPRRRGPVQRPRPRRRAHPPGRLQRLHRHGPGAGLGPQQPPHGAAQLPGPLRDARGQRVSVQPGDRGRLGAHRRHHRPAHARHGVPEGRAARAPHRQHAHAGAAPAEAEGRGVKLEKDAA